MDIGEILHEVWILPHWWDVAKVAAADDALLLARIFLGFLSWWYIWLCMSLVVGGLVWHYKRLKKKKREQMRKEGRHYLMR